LVVAHAGAYDELRKNGLMFWPSALATKEKEASVVPRLIETQDKFISLLHVADKSPVTWKEVLPSTSGLPANLFLKHLMVLADLGGEPLNRLKPQIGAIFTKRVMEYVWRDSDHSYRFKSMESRKSWGNNSLGVDGKGLQTPQELSEAMEDVAMLLLFGGASINAALPEILEQRCVLGALLGQKAELDKFVRQRYIWVSKIISGAAANKLGHFAQDYVKERLQALLPNWDFSKKTIPSVSQTGGRTDTAFDMVAESPGGKFCAIEVSFQFTTNSTIERKAGQAKSRHEVLARRGHKIAYVIDGAGNFERASALNTICRYSDCTVTFKDEEIAALAAFLAGLDRKTG
jgi:hypothetical protein